MQQKENSEFWNPTCVIGGNKKEALRNTKSDSRAFRGPKAGKYLALEDELLNYFE